MNLQRQILCYRSSQIPHDQSFWALQLRNFELFSSFTHFVLVTIRVSNMMFVGIVYLRKTLESAAGALHPPCWIDAGP